MKPFLRVRERNDIGSLNYSVKPPKVLAADQPSVSARRSWTHLLRQEGPGREAAVPTQLSH
jgi:hypothetical protein